VADDNHDINFHLPDKGFLLEVADDNHDVNFHLPDKGFLLKWLTITIASTFICPTRDFLRRLIVHLRENNWYVLPAFPTIDIINDYAKALEIAYHKKVHHLAKCQIHYLAIPAAVEW
jgi:hypothetical protein